MTIRFALIYAPRSTLRENFEPVLRDIRPHAPIALLEAAPGAPVRAMRQLIAARPQIVIAEAATPHALGAALYRTLRPQSRLLLCATDLPRRRLRFRWLPVRSADAVLDDPSDARRAIERLLAELLRPAPLPAVPDLDLFRFASPVRTADAAHRLLYVGDLSPASYAADALIALAAWAERHPDRAMEIWWAGDGDLSGVLAAQPLPPNLAQRFLGTVARPELAQHMARCGVLVAAADGTTEPAPIVEALAAGLVVVASRRIPAARLLVQAAGPGWTFDPTRPDGLAEALEHPLGCDPAHLDALREQGQRLARGLETAASQDAGRPTITDALSPLSAAAH